MFVELFTFQYSVYGRIVKIVLAEKAIAYETRETNPFTLPDTDNYLHIHPFKRVPAIRHNGFLLYETAVITHYLDEAFDGPSLQPSTPAERARMRQIMAIIDNYGYLPLVRKVFSQRVFRPAFGEKTNDTIMAEGLAVAPRILSALEDLLVTDSYAAGSAFSLADAHLGPMLDYFTMAAEGAEMLTNYPKLNDWWTLMENRSSMLTTRPHLP